MQEERENLTAGVVAEDRLSGASNDGSPNWISAVLRSEEWEHPVDEPSEGFEFAFAVREADRDLAVAADEIFAKGQIRPIYPVFGRNNPDSRSTSGSSSSSLRDEMEGVPLETYCAWTPRSVPDGNRKSGSGAGSLRLRIQNLVVRRSRSDGSHKLGFVAAEKKAAKDSSPNPNPNARSSKTKGTTVAERGVVTAPRVCYGRGGGSQGGKIGRQSFLPYKPDIVAGFIRLRNHK